jgi:hypothetical protein
MEKKLLGVLLTCFLFIQCAPQKTIVTEQKPKGKNVVCILYKPTAFKDSVIEKITKSLSEKNIIVVKENLKDSKYCKSSDYGAVIYMQEYHAWHVPKTAIKFHKRNYESKNTIFLITAGDPKLKIKSPFDAITCPSKKKNIDSVSEEIILRINNILK